MSHPFAAPCFSRQDGQTDRQKLFLRNPIRLDDVPLDEQNTIVFVLEYMLALPLGTPKKEVENFSAPLVAR